MMPLQYHRGFSMRTLLSLLAVGVFGSATSAWKHISGDELSDQLKSLPQSLVACKFRTYLPLNVTDGVQLSQ